MTSTETETYTCPYCRQHSVGAQTSCPACGAPVNVRLRTTSGGWTEQPPIPDMARIQAGQSTVQVGGGTCPVADFRLAAGDSVYFPHHKLVWQEPSVTLDAMPLAKAWTRLRSGLPLVMMRATGPGQIGLSHDTSGEVIALPIQAGEAVDVCEHRLIAATHAVAYDWYESGVWYSTSGRDSADLGAGAGLLRMGLELAGDDRERRRDETEWHYPMGRYLDRFTATDRPGLVMIGAGGNAYTRVLAEGQSLLVKPPAVLFKDPTVAVQLHVEYPSAGAKLWRSWGNRYLWLRVWGPGRIGIESSYEAHKDPGTDFNTMSGATHHAW